MLRLLIALGISACRPHEGPEVAIARGLASENEQTANSAAETYRALDEAGREQVVGRLAAELSKYPFGLAGADVALRRIAPGSVEVLLALRARPGMRVQTDVALQSMGPAAAPAVPALERSLATGEPAERVSAATALAWIAPERVGEVIAENADRDPQVALAIGLQLHYVPDAARAVPGLLLLLDDPRPRVREFAAAALGEAGPRAAPAVARLTAAIADPSPNVRRNAERALRAIGGPGPNSARDAR